METTEMSNRLNARVVIGCLAILGLCSWVMADFSPALASSNGPRTKTISVVIGTTTDYVDSGPYNVAPGASVTGNASCGKTYATGHELVVIEIIGGGYVMGGKVGDAIASATANYPMNDGKTWHTVISNPKLAHGDVSFRVRAVCMKVETEEDVPVG